jgi:hypothetical protein
LRGGQDRRLLGGQVGREGVVEARGIDRELHGRLAVRRRVVEGDQRTVEDAVLGGPFNIAQALAFFGAKAAT